MRGVDVRGFRYSIRTADMAVLGLIASVLLAGCGGKDQGKPTGLQVKPQLSVAPAQSSPPPVARRELPKPVEPPKPALKAGETLFAMGGEQEPEPRPDERYTDDESATGGNVDRFEVAMLPAGLNSTSFVVAGALENDGKAPAVSAAGIAFPPGFAAVADADGRTALEGLPRQIRCVRDGSIMVLVPGGQFIQGNSAGKDAPEHPVYLEHFYIDAYEITSAQYEQYREIIRREKRPVPRAPDGRARSPQDPVTGITWGDAQTYARWAGKELPTEAQWEKAARGEQGFQHPWGNGVHLWHRVRKSGQIDPVGSFPTDKSPYGAFDLAGNAREWCVDWYSANGYQEAIRKGENGVARNPTGPAFPEAEKLRVARGGDPEWRVWVRGSASNTERPVDVGFRCVLTFRPTVAPGKAKGR